MERGLSERSMRTVRSIPREREHSETCSIQDWLVSGAARWREALQSRSGMWLSASRQLKIRAMLLNLRGHSLATLLAIFGDHGRQALHFFVRETRGLSAKQSSDHFLGGAIKKCLDQMTQGGPPDQMKRERGGINITQPVLIMPDVAFFLENAELC